MKKYISQIITVVSLGVLLITADSCKKLEDFGDTNLNPNGVPEPILSGLLTNVSARAVGGIVTGTVSTQPPAMFAQYLAESTYPGISKYTGLQLDAQGTYTGVLMDCQVIINWNTDPALKGKASAYGDNNNQAAIATLYKSYILWTMTDRWGDLPYSEALQGANNLLPKYDTQEDIYKGLINDITAATDLLNPDAAAKVQGDQSYGLKQNGDLNDVNTQINQWRKLGNSLKMLMAIRLSKRYPGAGDYAATVFNAAINSPYGYITDNVDNFGVKYPGGAFQNPFYTLHISQDVAVALTFTDALNGLGDTRRQSMASSQDGAPYGLVGAAPIAGTYARTFNNGPDAENAFVVIISAASTLLAKAEAIERGWVTGQGTAKDAYDAGVAASFAQWGQTMPANYLTTGPANYTTGAGVASIGGVTVAGSTATTTTTLQRINLQQWIAFYPAGIQGWSNWRRTGIPDLQPTINALNAGGEIPRRYTYGVNDYTNNAAQVAIAAGRYQGGDVQDARIWWDQ